MSRVDVCTAACIDLFLRHGTPSMFVSNNTIIITTKCKLVINTNLPPILHRLTACVWRAETKKVYFFEEKSLLF